MSWASGSWVATACGKRATSRASDTVTRPKRNPEWRKTDGRRAGLASDRTNGAAATSISVAGLTAPPPISRQPDARIEIPVGQVDHPVDQHEERGADQDNPLHHRIIALLDRPQGQGTDPGPVEDGLGHDRGAQQG